MLCFRSWSFRACLGKFALLTHHRSKLKLTGGLALCLPGFLESLVVAGGELQFWLALEEVTPEMGPMRFINRSHREGPLGSVFNGDGDDLAGGVAGYRAAGNILDQYPLLPEVLGAKTAFLSRIFYPCVE